MKAEVILDESQFGNTERNNPKYLFYLKNGDKLSYLTNRDIPILVAVTKEQYKIWKNQEIIWQIEDHQ